VATPLQHFLRVAIDNSLLMIAGAVAALVWANVSPDGYLHATEPLHFVVNDVLMVFFFGVAMKEIIEATAPGGALHSLRRAGLPVIAAVGGMVGPAALYTSLALALGLTEILNGWAIPCATDIAFSYLVGRTVFGAQHPAVPFLLLLAIADDALGLVVLAVFYPSAPLQPIALVSLLLLACAAAWLLRRRRTMSFWPYLLGPGALSWAGFYLGGLHPALALVPILPFLPHAPRDPGLFVDAREGTHDPLNAFEHWWSVPVEFILFLFALVNAGVPIGGAGMTTWIVLGSLLAGKPIGICVFTWLAERVGFERPARLRWKDLVVLGVTAGIGFTVALFFATAAFPPGGIQDQAKLGALLSILGSIVAIGAARVLGVGQLGARRA
jgi:NhaA family Na+:H+ antiporter